MDWKQLYEALEGTARVSELYRKFGYVETYKILLEITERTYDIMETILEHKEEVREMDPGELRKHIVEDLEKLLWPKDETFIKKYKIKFEEFLKAHGYDIDLGNFAKRKVKQIGSNSEFDELAFQTANKIMLKLGRMPTNQDEVKEYIRIMQYFYEFYKGAKDYVGGPRNGIMKPIYSLCKEVKNDYLKKIIQDTANEFLKYRASINKRKLGIGALLIPHL